MEITPLRAEELEAFIDELWLPARQLYETEGYDVMRYNLKRAVGTDRG